MNKLPYIMFFLFCSVILKGQNFSILKGEIISETGEMQPSCTVMLLSPKDSSLISGGTFLSNDFEFTKLSIDSCILTVRDMLYEKYDTLISLHAGVNTIKIGLTPKSYSLDNTVVSARRSAFTTKNGNVYLEVQNSYLKNELKLSNILLKIPGILVNSSGAVSMLGKRNILIYIDDKVIISDEFLKLLQPSDIEKIEIINNPGSTYKSNIDAVININTNRKLKDYFRIYAMNNTMYTSKFNNNFNISFLLNKHKWNHYFVYGNQSLNGKTIEEEHVYNYLPNGINLNHRNKNSDGSVKWNNLYYLLSYDLSDKQAIGLQYSGLFNKFETQSWIHQQIWRDDKEKEKRFLDNNQTIDKKLHDFSINYKNQPNKENYISVIAGFVLSNQDMLNSVQDNSIDEKSSKIMTTSTKSDYKIFTTNAYHVYKRDKWSLKSGMDYSAMNLKSLINYHSVSAGLERHDLSENLAALYLDMNYDLGFISGSFGIRGEYAHTTMQFKKEEQKKKVYINIFPYISVSKTILEKVSATLSYRRYFNRPAISMWNPLYIYKDSLSYLNGNPDIKPMSGDLFSLQMNISKISFGTSYSLYYDSYLSEDLQDAENPEIIVGKFGNATNVVRVLSGYTNYSYINKWISVNTGLNVSKPYFKIPYQNGVYLEFKKPIWFYKISADLNLWKDATLNLLFYWQSKGEYTNRSYLSYYNFSSTLTQFFLDKKLTLSLSANDIFHSMRNNESTFNPNVCSMISGKPDSRSLALSICYQFGQSKKEIQQSSSNTKSINRM